MKLFFTKQFWVGFLVACILWLIAIEMIEVPEPAVECTRTLLTA